jgi:Histone methylation protein DOT1
LACQTQEPLDGQQHSSRPARPGFEARTVVSSLRQDAEAARGLRGDGLLRRLRAVAYDDRDAWVDALLGLPDAAPDEMLPRGGVPYIPCAVSEILDLVREVPLRPEDVLVDLGAGLGRVLMLAHLLSGARGRGVEIQQHLVDAARACAAARGLGGVTFEQGDAKDAALEGTVFFLYSPFNGETLQAVLRKLEALAKTQRVTIVSVDLELPGQSWLRERPVENPALALYLSR